METSLENFFKLRHKYVQASNLLVMDYLVFKLHQHRKGLNNDLFYCFPGPCPLVSHKLELHRYLYRGASVIQGSPLSVF